MLMVAWKMRGVRLVISILVLSHWSMVSSSDVGSGQKS